MFPKPDLLDGIFNDPEDETESDPVEDDPLDDPLDDNQPVEPDTDIVEADILPAKIADKLTSFEQVVNEATALLATVKPPTTSAAEPDKLAVKPDMPKPELTEEDRRRAELDAERHEDAVTARNNLKMMIKHGESLLNSLVLSAASSDDPKFYQAAAQMLKEVSSMNKDLMRLHKQEQELKDMNRSDAAKKEAEGPTTVIDKAVIVTSPSELLAAMKNKKQ